MNYDPRKAIRQAMMIARREVTAPNKASIGGQRHMLAYITPYEAELLMRRGGSGRLTEYGVPAFDDGDGGGGGGDSDGGAGGDAANSEASTQDAAGGNAGEGAGPTGAGAGATGETGPDDTDASVSGNPAAVSAPTAPTATAPFGTQGFGQAPSALGMGMIGTIGGLATGVPGLGAIGTAIGTGMDVEGLNAQLGMMGLEQNIAYDQALAHNMSLGMFGKSATDQFGQTLGFDALAEAPMSAFSAPQGLPDAPADTSGADPYYAGVKAPKQPGMQADEEAQRALLAARNPMQQPLMYAGGGAVGYADGGMPGDDPTVQQALRLSSRVTDKRTPQLQDAADLVAAGQMTPEEYHALVGQYKPVQPYTNVPPMASEADLFRGLSEDKHGKVGAEKNIPEGHPVGLRLDIPAYDRHGVWAPTIHDGHGDKAKAIAHAPFAHVSDPVFSVSENKALNVARGTAKSPFAKINGFWKPTSPEDAQAMAQEYLYHPEWRQVGMDPERHSFFYDRETRQPIVSAEEALQVGPLVLAKNPQYGKVTDYKYADGGGIDDPTVQQALSYTRKVNPMGLYSHAADVAANLPQQKGTPQQMLSMLTARGVKPDEINNSGAQDTFGNQKTVAKQDLVAHFQQNMPDIQEKKLISEKDAISLSPARFFEWTTAYMDDKNPEDIDYREILLHSKPHWNEEGIKDWVETKAYNNASDAGAIGSVDDWNNLPEAEKSRFVNDANKRLEYLKNTLNFKNRSDRSALLDQDKNYFSSHWHVPNVIGHIRMHDRDDGDTLHVEELQSDWGQAKRNGEDVPEHPLINNTNTWTDLLLKRVLREAARRGYKRIAWTPGQDQAERYDLSQQIHQLNYDPEDKVLSYYHKDRGWDDLPYRVNSDEIQKYVGKEIAKNLLSQPPSPLNGSHSLEINTQVGGEGMRAYYDKIVPARMTEITKKLGAPVKVEPYKINTRDGEKTLHSIVVTPELKSAVLKGMPVYKDGGTVGYADGGMPGDDPTVQRALNVTREYQDPPTKHIDDWAWKSLSDVQNRLGNFREIPSHVQAFGSYMDEIAKRAANEGLSVRDLIKAYTISRASIQRRANDVDRVRAAGLDLPKSFTGKIRPEGAFGEWLHTRAGQDYLNSAERGEVNEDAIANAVKIMTPFGKHEKDIPDALRWAANNLPGKEQEISTLVANAMRGASEPAEWRAMAKDVRGVGPSKAGFLASLMGRGDQPTLDARQIIEHTGRPTSEAQAYLRRKGGEGATEAVERLSARQQAMDLQLPEELKPYYQHLAHHAVWDKAANEVTTHEDVMNAMRGAAHGGEIDEASILSHPVVHALRLAGLPKLGDPPREGLRGGGSPDDDVVRQALQRVATPFSEDPEVVQQALRIASSLKVPQGAEFGTGSFYSVKQPMAVSDVSTKMQPIPGVDLASKKELTWEDFYKQGKGGTILNVGGDRSNLGRLTHINNKELAWPVDLHAGPKYMMEPNPGAVWANNPSHATALRKKILEAAEKGPVYGVYAPMGAQAVDSSHNMFDAVMAQVPSSGISKKDAKEFDDAIMNGLHVKGNDPKNVALRENAKKELEGWPGILNAKEASEYARNMPGGHRSAIVKFMDSKKWRDMNFPAIGITRVAITDPDLKAAAGNMLGHRIVEFDPQKIAEETKFQHSTYTSPTSGRYVGDVPLVQRHYAMPDVVERLLQKPTVSGQVVHPYSMDPLGRSTARKLFEEQKQLQPVNERMINTIGEGLERQKDYGLKKGGSVVDQALRMTAPDRPMVALADLFQRQLRGRPPS